MVHVERGKPKVVPSQLTPIAFELLQRRWASEVRRWVKARGVRTDVDDLVQEVFLVAYRRLLTFDGSNPGGWLYQIMRRKVRDYWRSRWITDVQLGDESVQEVPSLAAGPEATLDTHEKGHALQHLLESLGERERQALILFELDGASGRQIAAIQGVPLNTVWARIRAARAHLRKQLAQLESDWVESARSK